VYLKTPFYCFMALLGFSPFVNAQDTKAPLYERALVGGTPMAQSGSGGTFHIGPVDFVLSAGLNQAYSDNIGLAESNTEDDFITTPSLGLGVSWSFSQLNTLSSSFGLSFMKYWFHPELDSDSVLIDPNSRTDFDFYVGEVHFRVYDNINIQQDASTVAQLSQVTTFKRLSNVVGIDADWDLNLLTLAAGYSYTSFVTLEDEFSSLDHGSHNLRNSVGVRMAEVWILGVNQGLGFIDYEENVQNSSYTYNFGVFSNHTLTEYLRANASIGFTANIFESGGSINDSSDFTSYIFSFSLHNQLNRWLTHSVEFRRYVDLGIGSNFTDVHELAYQASLELIRNVSTSGNISYKWLEDSQSPTAEKSTHLTLSARLGYQLLATTSVGLSYTRTMKDSDRASSSYEQNRVSVDVSHQF
jgi:hypothetical protein